MKVRTSHQGWTQIQVSKNHCDSVRIGNGCMVLIALLAMKTHSRNS